MTEDYDKITEALNFEGKFFEKLVIDTVSNIPSWEIVKVEYPIMDEFSPRADFISKRDANHIIYIVGEVKKAHPKFKKWVFFPYNSIKSGTGVPHIYFFEEQLYIKQREVKREQMLVFCHELVLESPLFFCNDAKEVKSEIGEKSTTNARIEDGASQACLCFNGFINEEMNYLQHLQNLSEQPERVIRIIPVLVTNAELLICDTKNPKYDENFDISKDSVTYHPVPWLVYKYPIYYKSLIPSPYRNLDLQNRDYMKYKHIYVVNFNLIEKFLKAIQLLSVTHNPNYTSKSKI